MKAVQVEQVGTTATGARVVKVLLVADREPDNPPTTGAGIIGLNDTDVFAPFSVLYVTETNATHKAYIAGETGTFIPQ